MIDAGTYIFVTFIYPGRSFHSMKCGCLDNLASEIFYSKEGLGQMLGANISLGHLDGFTSILKITLAGDQITFFLRCIVVNGLGVQRECLVAKLGFGNPESIL